MNIAILIEDHFGPQFINHLFERMKSENIMPENICLIRSRKYAFCNPKLGNMVKAAISDSEKVIILIDADGEPIYNKEGATWRHIRNGRVREKVRLVSLDYEIEEWICASLGLQYGNSKPSSVLKHRLKYRKSRLPDYTNKLDFQKLSKSCASFRRFLQALE